MDESIDIYSKELFIEICTLIEKSRKQIAVSANVELAYLYWSVGGTINKHVLNFKRAEYGKQIIINLSKQLNKKFGKGWTTQQLRHCLRSAETFSENEILYALRRNLNWTHIRTLSYENEPLKRKFYFEMAIAQKWNTRTLEEAIIVNLQSFIMELGNGFAFLERQKRIQIDAVDYHLDLLFYHRKLKRLVAIDLKLGKFKPEHKAQMELYLRWLEKNEMQEGEKSPIGLLLCSKGNTEHVELLLLNESDIKVAQYLTELPNKQWFIDKLHRAIEIAKNKD